MYRQTHERAHEQMTHERIQEHGWERMRERPHGQERKGIFAALPLALALALLAGPGMAEAAAQGGTEGGAAPTPGAATAAEAEGAALPARLRKLLADFDEIDTDASGTLSPEELAAHAQQRFATADANGDGLLDRGELEASLRARMAARMAERRPARGGEGSRPPSAPPVRAARAEARIAWMVQGLLLRRDADGDCLLSPAEMQPRPARMSRLLGLDADGDGALSREELLAGPPGRPAAPARPRP